MGGIYLGPYGPELRTDQINQSEERCPTCPSSLLIGPSTSATWWQKLKAFVKQNVRKMSIVARLIHKPIGRRKKQIIGWLSPKHVGRVIKVWTPDLKKDIFQNVV